MGRQSPWMDDELKLLRDTARAFYAREVSPHREEWERNKQVDRDIWRKAGALGLLCASIPEEYGGGGGTFAHEAVLIEEGSYAGESGWANAVHSGIIVHYIAAYGTEEQKRRWLPGCASGDLVMAIAMTEPGTGSDLQSIKTTARRDGDHYIVNGAKTFITNGNHADLIIIAVKTDPNQAARGVSLIVAETADLPGFQRGRVLEKIGMKSQDTTELFFDNMRVPVANLLGETEGLGFVQLMQQLPQERLVIGLGAVASLEAVVDHTIRYTKQREAFGKPILEFQNTRFVLAEARTEAVVARAFIDDCVQRHLEGDLDAATASMSKWWSTQKLCDVVDACLQLHGGNGYMLEYPIARAYADARVQKIVGGTNEIMKELIARTL